jgi:hypothetical protein
MIKPHTMITLLLLSISSEVFATQQVAPITPEPPPQETTIRNKTYRFSFTLPAGWEKQSGQANSDNAFFMQLPISNSCSFQFNIVQMPETFSAEIAATTLLATAYRELRLNKLAAVKRRDTWIKERTKENSKEKEIVIFTRGWEITEKPHKEKLQRIIYQVYDRHNHYFNFVASASREKFPTCVPELRKIIDSISFLPV